MNKKMSKRQRDIKSKLMAAICMLLVSSIMMVSSTYAWFTLSTAPEVTGIQTAVGANGNLEMALQPYSGNLNEISSAEGDSGKPIGQRNITWGNLVDVNDDTVYGMDQITLYPSTLNTAVEGKVNSSPLAYPKYGADGRVNVLGTDTTTGAYDQLKAQFADQLTENNGTTHNNPKGVRAVGTSSSISPRMMAYRNALAKALDESDKANIAAGRTLNNNGSAIGNIAVKHALGNDGAGYSQDEIAPLRAAVKDLDSIANQIESSLIQYLLAESLAPAAAETTYATLVTEFGKVTTLAAAKGITGAVVPGADTAFATAEAKLTTLRTNIGSAKTKMAALPSEGSVTWLQLSDALSVLVQMESITVNGLTMDEIKMTKEEAQAAGKDFKNDEGEYIDGQSYLIQEVMANNTTALINMPYNTGVFGEIADMTGTYTGSFKVKITQPMDLSINAKLTATPQGTPYLTQVKDAVALYVAVDGGAGNVANPITTFYGYILDLAFRTNATNSYLKLQAESVDRIYTDGTNTNTMGHGATMTFSTTSTTFGDAGVKALMEHIRIIFFDTTSGEFIAFAKLDNSKATTDTATGAITMPIMLTTDGTFATAKTGEEAAKIMDLEPNTATALSVLVYLDGKTMQNSDVAADVAESMTGSMNLQFSSSAELKPMEYADLMSGDGGVVETQPTASVKNVTTGTVSDGYAATLKHITLGTEYKMVAVITKDNAPVTEGVTVTIGGETATYQTYGGQSGWVANATETVPTEAVNVTVTPVVENG